MNQLIPIPPNQELANEPMLNAAEPIPLTIPLDRPEPQPQQSPGRLELEPIADE